MSTPQEPGIDEPVSLDELSAYLVGGLLTPAQEERLLMRISRDPDAPSKMAKLRGIDARISAVLDHDSGDVPPGDDPQPMGYQRAARLQASLADLALRRSEQQSDEAADEDGTDAPSS